MLLPRKRIKTRNGRCRRKPPNSAPRAASCTGRRKYETTSDALAYCRCRVIGQLVGVASGPAGHARQCLRTGGGRYSAGGRLDRRRHGCALVGIAVVPSTGVSVGIAVAGVMAGLIGRAGAGYGHPGGLWSRRQCAGGASGGQGRVAAVWPFFASARRLAWWPY